MVVQLVMVPVKLSRTNAGAVRLNPSKRANDNAARMVELLNLEHKDFRSGKS